MNTNDRNTPKRAAERPLDAAHMLAAARDDGEKLITRLLWGALALAIFVAAGLLMSGCGRQSEERTASAPQPATAVVASQPGSEPLVARATGATAGSLERTASDSLPPDVAASVYGAVLAGGQIEVSAESSPDVVSVTLGDPTGGRQPFAFDANTGLWRVAYRVPVKPASERIALSVTAKNGAGRWRRVWTFLEVEPRVIAQPAPADSSSKQ